MKVCPNCQYKELPGAIFCSECGTQLIFAQDARPGTMVYSSQGQSRDGSGSDSDGPASAPPSSTGLFGSHVSLRVVDGNITLPLPNRDEITLGRISEGQPVMPDIDLSPFGAYEAGVSRLHALINIHEAQVTLSDLGSANGTRINGKRIAAHIAYPIQHGDVLTFGKLKIQILIRGS